MAEIGVAVVGGGWAGLAAALALKEAGADFLLLEASLRLGGRCAPPGRRASWWRGA